VSAWANEPGRDVPYGYRERRVGLEPRWTPDRPLAERITRRGRWEGVDPLRRGRVWSRYRWGMLVVYLGYMGALFARASREDPGS
jgi:hypothetical protein